MPGLALSIIAVVISIITVGWTLYYNLSQRRASSVRYVLELHANYHSHEMIVARRIAWHDLNERMNKDNKLTWETLWKDNTDSDKRIYNHLQLVLQFWFQLYALDKMGLLDRTLSSELFGYQFGMWRKHLLQLAINTQEYDDLQPDIINSMLDNQLEWLITMG
ncbi:hypothetical protein ACFL6H_10195 [Candidatus Latescibacterota bacterium]